MSDELLFHEEKHLGTHKLALHGGRASLTCTVFERWDVILLRLLSCGNQFSKTLRRRIGVTKASREELEATITGTVGLKGIAELESKLAGRLSREVTFEESQEEEETYTFIAPKCGGLTVRLYQLFRRLHFAYLDDRWLHKNSWTYSVWQALDRVHDSTKVIKNDPDCGCDARPDVGIDGQLYLDAGKISMVLGFVRSSTGIDLPALGAQVQDQDGSIPFGTVLKRGLIPEHLLFLAAETSEELHASFRPYAPDAIGETARQAARFERGESTRERKMPEITQARVKEIEEIS